MDGRSHRLEGLTPEQRALFTMLMAREGRAEAPIPRLPRAGFPAEFPLSFAQERLWFLHRLDPDAAVYNLSSAVHLEGPLDVAVLERAIDAVVARHDSLRTTFPAPAGRVVQRVGAPAAVELPITDLSALGEAATGALRSLLEDHARRPIDLERGPVMRLQLVRLGPERHVLAVTMSHLVTDGYSVAVLSRELGAAYEALVAGAAAFPGEPPLQYADYAAWQRDRLRGPEQDRLLAFWRHRLAPPVPRLELPTDRPRPRVRRYRGGRAPFALDARSTGALARLAGEHQASLFAALLALYSVVLSRYAGTTDVCVGAPVANRGLTEVEAMIGCVFNTVVYRTSLAHEPSFQTLIVRAGEAITSADAHAELPFDQLIAALDPERDPSRTPLFQALISFHGAAPAPAGFGGLRATLEPIDNGTSLFDLSWIVSQTPDGLRGVLEYDADLFDAATLERMAENLAHLARAAVETPDVPVGRLPVLAPREDQLLDHWNQTGAPSAGEAVLHEAIEAQVARTPDAIAVIGGEVRMSYRALDRAANRIAGRLRALGVGPESRVAVATERSPRMVAALLGVLKAGGAYVPVDPSYPAARVAFLLEDARVSVVLADATGAARLGVAPGRSVVRIDEAEGGLELEGELASGANANANTDASASASASANAGADADANNGIDAGAAERPARRATPSNLAYVIYTSGSTGQPKGVMIEHRSVMNFLRAMDRVLEGERGGTWRAVTSISFDISILELFWTLARGFQVVLDEAELASVPVRAPDRAVELSLFYFADDARAAGADRYRLLLDGARFADERGFAAVWTPERHFHPFGGLYPNPAVTSAALATITRRVRLRAGSVVLPLHDPIRVAEDWAVVDNLSGGRVDVSFASGWHADDFVLAPERYEARKDIMLRGIETVRKLWRGDRVTARGGMGKPVEVGILPRPIQPELPVWVTAAGGPDTFVAAAELGAGVLTHLLGQTIEELTGKIALYREAWRRFGHPGDGRVSLMLHAYLDDTAARVREVVREPFLQYLRSSVGLLGNLAKSLGDRTSERMSPDDVEALLHHAFDRYVETSALFGTVDGCEAMIRRLARIGVDEVACLIDFGVPVEQVMGSLERLDELRRRVGQRAVPEAAQEGVAAGATGATGATHLQCTPSLAASWLDGPGAAARFGGLDRLLLGGEALPPALVSRLAPHLHGALHNMYGPTETTVWSTTDRIDVTDGPAGGQVTIGRPIDNTEVHVLDGALQRVPIGVVGELFIGGEGVARGYLQRPDLTAERFLPDPFGPRRGGRIYRTGDRARFRPDGRLELLGRMDQQVKVRGHRIEPGEVEAAIGAYPGIRECAVVARQDGRGDGYLAAFIVPVEGAEVATSALHRALRDRLPAYLVPSLIVPLAALPRTPNGKLDRGALPEVGALEPVASKERVAPRTPLEKQIAVLWTQILGREPLDVHTSFFELGGHSLMATHLVTKLGDELKVEIPLRRFFEAPTIAGLAACVEEALGSGLSEAELRELEAMSDGEVEALLASERAAGGER